MPNYSEIAAKISSNLAKAGAAVTLRKISPGTHNYTTGQFSGGSQTDYQVYGLLQSGTVGSTGQRYFNNTLVQTNDRIFLLSTGAVPEPGDQVVFGDQVLNVVSVLPVDPGGIPIMYRVLARK